MKGLGLFIATLTCGTLLGQPVRTLDQCIGLALKQNPLVLAAGAQIRAVESARSEISTTVLPRLTYDLGASYAPWTTNFGYDPVISNQGEIGARLMLQQPVYDGGTRGIRTSQLDLGIERTLKNEKIVRRDLTATVTHFFIELLRVQREAQSQAESVEQLAEYLNLVHQLSSGGGASATDLLKTRVHLASARIALQKAVESVASAKVSLAEVIGGEFDTAFTVRGSLDSLAAQVSDTTSREATLNRNLDLRAADLALKMGLLEADLARSERRPVISVFADAGLLTSGENLRLPSISRSSMVGYSVGITVEGLLYDWGGTSLRIQQREAEADILRFQRDTFRRSLSSDFDRTSIQLANARQRLGEIRTNLALVEATYLLTKSKYAGGGALSLEVLDAQQLLTETHIAETQTLADIALLSTRLTQLGTPE